MKYSVDRRLIKTRELIAAEGNLTEMNKLMARFMVDEADAPIPPDEALDLLFDLNIEDNQAEQYVFLAALTPQTKSGRR